MKAHNVVIVVLLVFIFLFANNTVRANTFPPLPEAAIALESDEAVSVRTVTVDEWEEGSNFYYAFEPKAKDPTIGFIIYPGGWVDPEAYAPVAHAIAAEGYLTVIVKMINDLAGPPSIPRANTVMSDYPGIAQWVIGGHSMGGLGACRYAKEFTDKIAGVVLWAAYPSELYRIDDKDLAAISIYGTNDGVVTADEIELSKTHLPPGTEWVPIEGANHTYYGWYDTYPDPLQPGDNPADLTREEQQDEIVQATVHFLVSFEEYTCPATYILGKENPGLDSARHLRDNVLANMAGGKRLISLYYQYGKSIIELFAKNPTLKKSAKKILECLFTNN